MVASVEARRSAQLEKGRNRQVQLVSLGAVMMGASHVWCATLAFGVSVGWGLLVLTTPAIGMLAFTSCHWEDARAPAIGYGAGAALLVLGATLF